ncbi:MAG: hypothetical protein C7B44_05890 [Sulfobacillus thermosulfidooxidans]|uniref:Uncharacterized protein n=1 Tax=Sulfobacillus thermotolerans TaxID=338644 RepID=A0ABN5H1Y5_9FIRM|nr:hypothetical protein [Sulfobacillus sp. hq2]AUW94454.1 hypothetical protein BXT84_11305 [Sulfobacillus thermotolerans]MCY0908345.1 hypothetical protein [Sulfobacillus thermotolerans]POB09274.1 hypothetical protein CO251_13530 [Sulfobacillus sp. hq2]PSR37026.1 MAG: hypothetical protein C7B44_05890 [Sulfobacillus thermosulfidooxidans]
MAVEVLALKAQNDYWTVELSVFEGVYRKERYVVRVVDVPKAPSSLSDQDQETRMKEFVLDQVKRHMRRGSLPPTGMQVEGVHVWDYEADEVKSS